MAQTSRTFWRGCMGWAEGTWALLFAMKAPLPLDCPSFSLPQSTIKEWNIPGKWFCFFHLSPCTLPNTCESWDKESGFIREKTVGSESVRGLPWTPAQGRKPRFTTAVQCSFRPCTLPRAQGSQKQTSERRGGSCLCTESWARGWDFLCTCHHTSLPSLPAGCISKSSGTVRRMGSMGSARVIFSRSAGWEGGASPWAAHHTHTAPRLSSFAI